MKKITGCLECGNPTKNAHYDFCRTDESLTILEKNLLKGIEDIIKNGNSIIKDGSLVYIDPKDKSELHFDIISFFRNALKGNL